MTKWLITIASFFLVACAPSKPVHKNYSSELQEIAPNIFVDVAMSEGRRLQLLHDIDASKQRIARFFGNAMQAHPKIYACVTSECERRFGEAPEKMEAKAMGDGSIMLTKAGCNETVISHELTHIEFHHRLGGSVNLNHIPMWFDEGLAMMVCQDPRYVHDTNIPLNAHHHLRTEEQWMSAIRAYRKPYQSSYQAMKSWYSQYGTEGLQSLIETAKKTGRIDLNPSASSQTSLALHQSTPEHERH